MPISQLITGNMPVTPTPRTRPAQLRLHSADITQTDLVAETTFTYDDAHRLTGLSHDKGLTNLADYSWTYDTFGRLTSVTTVDGTDDYTYDDTGQLTGVDSDYQTDETYTYDAGGPDSSAIGAAPAARSCLGWRTDA